MESLTGPLSTLLEPMATARAAEREQMLTQMQHSKSALDWVASRFPRLARSLAAASADPSPEDLASHTLAELEDWSLRLEQCSRCPDTGGACDSEPALLCRPGRLPRFVAPRIEQAHCPRWRIYTLRRYLAVVGVPDAHLGDRATGFRGYAGAVEDHVIAFTHGTSLLVLGPPSSGKTHLAVATLAMIVTHTPHLREKGLGFLNVPRLVAEARRQVMTDSDGELFAAAAAVHTLVLDDLGGTRPTDWSTQALVQLLRDRIDACRPTLVTADSLERLERVLGPDFSTRILAHYARLDLPPPPPKGSR